ncbi:hypothetical protein [Olsenella uli]|uniref:hypothetical protein n=1 Tax=Olsenella uli TaxID=133926 RepID=UPI0012DD69A9|nr:hypothetical protein [Olsenella uli]
MDEIRPRHEVTARKPHRCSWCGKEILWDFMSEKHGDVWHEWQSEDEQREEEQ